MIWWRDEVVSPKDQWCSLEMRVVSLEVKMLSLVNSIKSCMYTIYTIKRGHSKSSNLDSYFMACRLVLNSAHRIMRNLT